jgi:8-oxo-dGTP pyrophosphatase MutT (NUDIX family)
MSPFTEADVRQRAAQRLLQIPPPSWNRSDDDMNERARMIPENVKHKPAAVLIPIVARDELSVLLTQRTAQLKSHAGQIAFPGGRIDKGEDATAAALREAQEETGLASEHVRPIGFLDGYLTITAFLITPVVAIVRPGFSLQRAEAEVDDIFEVPLSFLMRLENCQRCSREWQGKTRYYNAFQWQDRNIWGATAGIIKNMAERMYG